MSKLTEFAIEDFAIKQFERLGYACIHARMDTVCSYLNMHSAEGGDRGIPR